jgi:hypothetical protein
VYAVLDASGAWSKWLKSSMHLTLEQVAFF